MHSAVDRRELKNAMARVTLERRHTAGCELLPDRAHLLDEMPKGAVAAEIGVAFGDYTREIMNRTDPARLFLIDAWATERYREGLAKIRSDWAGEIDAGRIVIEQGLSTDVLPTLAPGSLDWAYIDTNHAYQTTLEELELCRTLVKPGGRIAGHDFCTGNVIDAVPYGVVEAVAKFCHDHDWGFRFLTLETRGHFSFCLEALA